MRLVAFLFIAGITGIGLLRLVLTAGRLEQERLFTETYLNKFRRFTESYLESFDAKEYHWLTHRVMKIQALAGDKSYWLSYGSDYVTEAAKKSDSMVGILDQMGQQPVPVKTLTSTTSFLVRFLGVLDDFIVQFKKRQRSPLTLFREGVQVVLLSPVLLASWARGTDSDMSLERAMQNFRFRGLFAFFSVVGLLVPVLIIIFGWEAFESFGVLVQTTAKSGYGSLKELVKTLVEESQPPVPPVEPGAS